MGYYVLDEIEKGDYKFSLDTFLGDPAANICCWVYYKGKPLNIEGTNDQVHKVFPQDHGSVNRSHLYNFTLTFLNQGDKVFDANFTKKLLDNSTIATQKNMPDYAGMAKAIEKNIQNIQNLSGNTYVNNFYIDGAQDTDSILKEIDKHLDKKIQAHDKKQVRDFKSLR